MYEYKVAKVLEISLPEKADLNTWDGTTKAFGESVKDADIQVYAINGNPVDHYEQRHPPKESDAANNANTPKK